jgi:galactokinase
VMSAAIDKGTIVAGSRTDDNVIKLYAADIHKSVRIAAGEIRRNVDETWSNYVLGVALQIQQLGIAVSGFNAAIHSNVPLGAGLSSSASLGVSAAFFLKQIYPFELDKMDIALLVQRSENQFVGVSSGLLDQFSSVFGSPDHLLFLDCLTKEHERLKLSRHDLSLVICDSLAKHSLLGGDYNTRRAECMAAAAHFGKELLRDVTIDDFETRKHELPDNQRKRAQHVIDENARVLQELMIKSHYSSRYLFENSTPELDFLVDIAKDLPGCLGCRLTGGGWGGATINLVEDQYVKLFSEALSDKYKQFSGKDAPVFVSAISDGAHEVAV